MKYHCLTSFNQLHECMQAQQNEYSHKGGIGAHNVNSNGVKHDWQCKLIMTRLFSCGEDGVH